MIEVEWKDITKSDIDKLTAKIIEKYADDSGQETHSSRDHKKILKIFFRWLKPLRILCLQFQKVIPSYLLIILK